ncbi:hypothetical protein, partial [Campylobacter pinnipediorum]|uniref:hypothetical protein n=1 Tax=Campylobacter pinnipediorum TaxID=1965231 RepID=UPI00112FBE24
MSIYIISKGDNQDIIKLDENHNIIIEKLKGDGVITSEAGINSEELGALTSAISSSIDNFKTEIAYPTEEYYALAKTLIKAGDQELSNKEDIISILNKMKNYGTVDDVFEAKLKEKESHLEEVKALKVGMQGIQKLVNAIGKNEPNQTQIDAINKYLKDNKLIFTLDKKEEKTKDYYDGAEKKLTVENFKANKEKIQQIFKDFFEGYTLEEDSWISNIDKSIEWEEGEIKKFKSTLEADKAAFKDILKKLGIDPNAPKPQPEQEKQEQAEKKKTPEQLQTDETKAIRKLSQTATPEAKKAAAVAIANNPANKLDNDTKAVFIALGDIASNELVS